RQECINSSRIESVRLARTAGTLALLGSYPGLILSSEKGCLVYGDLYELSDPGPVLEQLDRIEGFSGYGEEGSLFRRAITSVTIAEGRRRPAWVYVYNRNDDSNPITTGNWRTRDTVGQAQFTGREKGRKHSWNTWSTALDLSFLKATIEQGAFAAFTTQIDPWGGAGVIIGPEPDGRTAQTVVFTKHWRELSWLFKMLRVYFDWAIDHLSKYEFFGRLAQAAVTSGFSDIDDPRPIMSATTVEAERMLSEIGSTDEIMAV
ncbi:MAG: gamma-glutamylcyclotransferase family protein, partial [Desulfomonilia bacterium]|nr:gamma-glutamylcyclotransferase family protein [Desulfomonilia bacterium]